MLMLKKIQHLILSNSNKILNKYVYYISVDQTYVTVINVYRIYVTAAPHCGIMLIRHKQQEKTKAKKKKKKKSTKAKTEAFHKTSK